MPSAILKNEKPLRNILKKYKINPELISVY